jgi:hypothetical protein
MGWAERKVGLRGWGFEGWYGAPQQLLANVSFLAGYRRHRLIADDMIAAVTPGCSTARTRRRSRVTTVAKCGATGLVGRGLNARLVSSPG